MDYDRYSKFRVNGGTQFVPFIPIPVKDTDYYEIYEKGKTRLDLLSYQYYGDADLADYASKSSVWLDRVFNTR